MIRKIPTRRSLACRAWRYMERSWWPLAIIVVMLVIVANFPD